MAVSKLGIAKIAGRHYMKTRVPAHAAATATENVVLFCNQDAAIRIYSAQHIPDTIVTGTATNMTNLNLLVGPAATVELAHIDYDTGVDTAAMVGRQFLTTTGTAFTMYTLAAAASLVLQYEKVSTGLAIPAGLIVIEFEWA